MTFPILVQTESGRYTATLLRDPQVSVDGSTRNQAIEGLAAKIRQRVAAGDLLSVDVPARQITDLAGKYADDPTLRDICDEAYRERLATDTPRK